MGKAFERLKGRLLAKLGARGPFRSHGELFAAVDRLVCALEDKRYEASAAAVRHGFASLNGLTDGWADFLVALEKAEAQLPPSAPRDIVKRFRDLKLAAAFAVYGR